MRRAALVITCAAVLAAAACGATAHPAASSAPTSGAPSATPSALPPAAPAVVHGNITIASTSFPPGPFTITPLYCGKFTAAQQGQYGTNAAGGLVYRYANTSNSLTAGTNLSVNFTSGSAVLGNNVTGNVTQISPGQSATGEVDALNSGGGNLAFTGCELMSYGIQTVNGDQPGNYAP